MNHQKLIMRVSVISMLVNLFLSLLKLIAGFAASSGAMISDAIHSASDVFSTIIVMIGVKISSKAPDSEHPYGHERFECVAAILLSVFLAMTGFAIGKSGVMTILSASWEDVQAPGRLALIAAVISIFVKEGMYQITARYAKKARSAALMADAWHHRSDALSSVGALVGIFFARRGYPIMDPIAGVIICLFIFKAAFDIFQDATDKMVDHACPPALQKEMRQIILTTPGVEGIHKMRTRLFGSRIYLDLEIEVDETLSLRAAHSIAEEVHHGMENRYEDLKHCMVHVNPKCVKSVKSS
ncbi:MAG: cation diffusion facilitator family transporter [Dorea sp.]|nr:cation diffusion facilitator family transporter [Dorea sp.]